MIREYVRADSKLAISSDRWHVVHSRWSGQPGKPRFERTIVSEHDDSESAAIAALEYESGLPDMTRRASKARDQVIVRRPSTESLKRSGRFVRRRR